MDLTPWIAIVNPSAASGRIAKQWSDIFSHLQEMMVFSEYVFSEYPGHCTKLVQDLLKDGWRKFIIVGGDGTLSEVANGIMSQQAVPYKDITISLIPCGTGNDWSKAANIPTDIREAVKCISRGHVASQDVGKVTYTDDKGQTQTRYMVNTAGVGYDAEVCMTSNSLKAQGLEDHKTYLKSTAANLFKRVKKDTTVIVDGTEISHCPTLSIAIGNGRFSGGGMTMVPDAVPNDGLINVTVIGNLTKMKAVLNLRALYNGSIYEVRGVRHAKGKVINISSTKPDYVEIDGEVVGFSPCRIEVVPNALNVVVGAPKS
ncbi:MAG: diacylglycerol kinase family lipid kinase [Bacteroidales bacterium]|nr:diacylglycerol kinase family lipid kinase [Bacteroidales bacterium]